MEFNQQQNPIHTLLADNKYQVLQEEIKELGTQVNVVVKGEHLQEVERQKWMIKKRAMAVIQTSPYRYTLNKMRVAIIQYKVYWLNKIPKEEQYWKRHKLTIKMKYWIHL